MSGNADEAMSSPPETPSKRVKNEYSQNVNTVRERNRIANMDEATRKQHNERKREREAVDRVRRRVRGADWAKALPEDKQEAKMEEEIDKFSAKRAKKREGNPEAHMLSPHDFYKKSMVQAKDRAYEKSAAWVDCEDDEEIINQNELLEKVEEHTAIERKAQQPLASTTQTLGLMYLRLQLSEWSYFVGFWADCFKNFLAKVAVLNDRRLTWTGEVPITKSLLHLTGLKLKRHRKLQARPETRTKKNFHGVIFNRRNFGTTHHRRPAVLMKHWLRGKSIVYASEEEPLRLNLAHLPHQTIAIAKAICRREPLQPHMVFSPIDRVIFRYLFAWDTEAFWDGKYMNLPGPAWLWPNDYDFKKFGFEPESEAKHAKSIWQFVMRSHDYLQMPDLRDKKEWYKIPVEFSNMLKSTTELRWKNVGEVDTWDADL